MSMEKTMPKTPANGGGFCGRPTRIITPIIPMPIPDAVRHPNFSAKTNRPISTVKMTWVCSIMDAIDASSWFMAHIKDPQCSTDMKSMIWTRRMKLSLPVQRRKGRKMMLARARRSANPVNGGSSNVMNLMTTALPAHAKMTKRPRKMSLDVIILGVLVSGFLVA